MIEVIKTATWSIHGRGQNTCGGIVGKLSACKSGGSLFFVRENIAYDTFRISSGERLGIKQGKLPSLCKQVLELCAPAEEWDSLATAVQQADSLGRDVRGNRLFTVAWAKAQFRRAA